MAAQTITPEGAQQASVIYLTAAKLDATPEQAALLSTITGPADTADDFRRIRTAVKAIMGDGWNLSERWTRRLVVALAIGTNPDNVDRVVAR